MKNFIWWRSKITVHCCKWKRWSHASLSASFTISAWIYHRLSVNRWLIRATDCLKRAALGSICWSTWFSSLSFSCADKKSRNSPSFVLNSSIVSPIFTWTANGYIPSQHVICVKARSYFYHLILLIRSVLGNLTRTHVHFWRQSKKGAGWNKKKY